MPSQALIPAEIWEAHRTEINDLYINQDLSLVQVVSAMEALDFRASKQSFARQFKKWKMFKNQKGSDWRTISRVLDRRTRAGKLSAVLIKGCEIPQAKVRKETSRYDLPSLMPRDPTPELMDYISIRTPPPLARGDLELLGIPGVFPHGQVVKQHVVVDGLPSLEFMDSLDLNGKMELIRRS